MQAMTRSTALAQAASAAHATQVAALSEQRDMAAQKVQELQLQLTKVRSQPESWRCTSVDAQPGS